MDNVCGTTEKSRGQEIEVSRVDSTGDKAETLVEDGGSDHVDGPVGEMTTEGFLVIIIFMMLDDRSYERIVRGAREG